MRTQTTVSKVKTESLLIEQSSVVEKHEKHWVTARTLDW